MPDNLPPNPGEIIIQEETQAKPGGLEKNFNINFEQPLGNLSGEFAKAYQAVAKKPKMGGKHGRAAYALVFERSFPARLNLISFLQNLPNDEGNFLSVLDSGVVRNKTTDSENLAVILEQPKSPAMSELFANSPVTDKFLTHSVIGPLNEIIGSLTENRLIHGRINADNVYFDQKTEKVILGEALSEPCGFTQPLVYEPLERAVCHPLAKGDGHPGTDFYALGVLILALITGKRPMAGVADKEIIERRFEEGSYGLLTQGLKLPTFVAELLKGLLSDRADRRWSYMQVDSWIRKKLSTTPPSLTREAMRGFAFGEKEYYSTRYLAHVFAHDTSGHIKHSLKPVELSRWVKHSVLRPELAERFDSLPLAKHTEAGMLDDEDIGMIVTLLDPTGPLRLEGHSLDIYGLGPFLAYAYQHNNREYIQLIGNIFTSGLLQFWLDAVETEASQEDTRYQDLAWVPRKVMNFIRKSALGFGMERVLYEMNPSLPCQSPLLGLEYVDDLSQLLQVLDQTVKDKYETSDPVDRHIAGFIAAKIDLREEISLKKLTEFPKLAQSPQMLMLAILLAAQTAAKIKTLKGLSGWIAERMLIPLETVRSHNIRDEIIKNIRRAARDGNLQELYRVATNANYFRRDGNGFKEAARNYQQLTDRINFMERKDNNERLAYEYGLRLSMILSYVICAGTLIYLLTRL